WGRVEDIEEILSVGQQVEVLVKSLDWDAGRFSFSLKEAQADPWLQVREKYPEGSIHAGKVVRLASFGAFVNLGEGIDGLVHISRLGGGKRINHPREVVQEGATLQVKVEKIDLEARRIGLLLANAGAVAEAEPEEDFRRYLQDAPSSGMGTLGDLLKKQQHKKKKR
ncbi:MAG: S1 RNA-binding domain-containing protein, partial [Desulfuromonadaceae bacterium]